MRRNKAFAVIFMLMLLAGCIEPYLPSIREQEVNKIVVSGKVNGVEGWQEVFVSMASPVVDAEFLPISGCGVSIQDNFGHEFACEEADPGRYRTWINDEYFVTGHAFMVSVTMPDGEQIRSAYDTLPAPAVLDSVYYRLEHAPGANTETDDPGVRFYTDLNGTEGQSRFYRWEVKETWEYHSAHPKEYYYDGRTHQIVPPDYSTFVCWSNVSVKDIFILSTRDMEENQYPGFALHFIDGHTSRLGILYSILVSQQAINAATYDYLEVVRENSGGFGGLYEKQPFSIKGNITSVTDPDREVLGYFYVCRESSKRYFYQDIQGLVLDFSNRCNEAPLGQLGWGGFSKLTYPVYYYFNENDELRTLNHECVDCRLRGGNTVKPEFWPN